MLFVKVHRRLSQLVKIAECSMLLRMAPQSFLAKRLPVLMEGQRLNRVERQGYRETMMSGQWMAMLKRLVLLNCRGVNHRHFLRHMCRSR
jgi:hypothetical protein